VTDDELLDAMDAAFSALEKVADRDWSRLVGSLEWTCLQTIDHTIDCVHSFALQIGAQADSGFLPFAPMHAELLTGCHWRMGGAPPGIDLTSEEPAPALRVRSLTR
jgi:hypothetical protein